jgi:hypothetical protein
MKTISPTILLLAVAATPALPQEVRTAMGPIADYLLDESYEIALAMSAAPDHIARDATVLVFRRDGYHQVRDGTNGFTCLVERSWSSPMGPHRDFYNPRLRAPICYNAEASRTVMGDYLRRTELALAGKKWDEIQQVIRDDIATGRLQAPRELAMSYMLSAGQLLGTRTGRYKPHVMFYVPYTTAEHLGSNPGTTDYPVMFEHEGGPFAALIVPVAEWNETPAEASSR